MAGASIQADSHAFEVLAHAHVHAASARGGPAAVAQGPGARDAAAKVCRDCSMCSLPVALFCYYRMCCLARRRARCGGAGSWTRRGGRAHVLLKQNHARLCSLMQNVLSYLACVRSQAGGRAEEDAHVSRYSNGPATPSQHRLLTHLLAVSHAASHDYSARARLAATASEASRWIRLVVALKPEALHPKPPALAA